MSKLDKKLSFVFEKPLLQAAFIYFLYVFIVLVGWGFQSIGIVSQAPLFPWLIATAFILLYTMINVVSSLSVDNPNKYWGHSIYAFILYVMGSGLTAYLISGVTISDAASYKWLYLMLSIAYLVFISIARMMRFVVELAQKQDKRMQDEKD